GGHGVERPAVPGHHLLDQAVRDRDGSGVRQLARRARRRPRHGRIRAVRRLHLRRPVPAGDHRAPAPDRACGAPAAANASARGRAMSVAPRAPTMGLLFLAGIAAPLLLPDYTNQIAVLWLMIVFALTWDILGGQMGYNSLGNIVFFGTGMYVSAVVQIGLFYDVGMYTSRARTTHIALPCAQYFPGIAL